MNLGPFPKGADRPWRGVWVYAAHGVEQQLRSPTFWMAIATYVLLLGAVGAFVFWKGQSPDLRVNAPSAMHASIEAAADTLGLDVVVFEENAKSDELPILALSGTPEQLVVHHISEAGFPSTEQRRFSKALIRQLRIDVALEPTLIAEFEAMGVAEAEAVDQMEDIVPMLLGVVPMMALITGVGAATQLGRTRDEEYFAVLRMGTPPAVILLGGLLERVVMSALMYFPMTAMVLLMIPLLVAGQTLTMGVVQTALIVVLAVAGGMSAYFMAAMFGTVMGSLSRGQTASATRGIGVNMTVMMVAMLMLQPPPAVGLSLWLLVPGLGGTVAAEGVLHGMAPFWVFVTVLVHLMWSVVAIRIAAWAFSLDETPKSNLTRRFRSWRGAP